MKTDDSEVLKAIEEWTGHADDRFVLKVTCAILAAILSVLIAFVVMIYFGVMLIKEWPS